MQSIIIHDADWKVSRLDELVKKGVFSSRAEAYRAGALLVATLPNAHELRSLGQLDSSLFSAHLKRCLSKLREGDSYNAKLELQMVITALRVRALLGPLLGEDAQWTEDYESLANDLSRYDDSLSQFNNFPKKSQTEILEDLRRDIEAILQGIKQNEIPERGKGPKLFR